MTEGMAMFGYDQVIRVAYMICGNTFPVNEGMVDPSDSGWQHCWCPFCNRGTNVKVISVN